MLKTRIIGVVLVKNGIAVQSREFKTYLPIGKPEIAIRYLDQWGVDEIVVLNISGAHTHTAFSAEQVSSYAKQCHVPLAIGGGVRNIQTVKDIIRAGADKIILNYAALHFPELITASSDLFGQQCVVVSLDVKQAGNGKDTVWFQGGKENSSISAVDLGQQMQSLGAGEIFLTSIAHDGCKQGYDLDLIKSLQVLIPVIACGGAGHPHHVYEAILAGASAVAIGNCFHYTEHSVILFKKYLAGVNASIRQDNYVSYQNNIIDDTGRLSKLDDNILETLRFQYIPEETI